MNKLSKTILMVSIAVFGTCFLPTNFSRAQIPNIVVEIWDKTDSQFEPLAGGPIFNLSNFLPGETETERIRVTNNTSQSQTIGLKIINFDRGCIDSYCLADKLYLTVGESGNGPLYSGSLTQFYQVGEVPLSPIGANGGRVEYDLSVYFEKETAEKEYQGTTTQFNLEIGFFTKETVSPQPPATGGGYTPPISGVVTIVTVTGPSTVTSDSATISCTTDILAYCRIIYDTESHLVLGNPPNYGYAFTAGPTEKDTSHNITLTDLEPNTTYYYRVVCWASPQKVSEEYSFTTLGVKLEEEAGERLEEEIEKEALPEGIALAPAGESQKPLEEIAEKEKIVAPEIKEPIVSEGKSLQEVLAEKGLLAAIGAMPFSWKLALIIIGVIVIGLIILFLTKKKKVKD